MENKKYFKYLDIIRGISCIAVLLYHLNVLKGGFLAVCCFFVLSGYLTCRSLLSREKVDLKGYYINRFKRVYLPLVCVVFITIAVISFVEDLVWVSLKPETTSVLLGYNNFWQINANADYFARHTASPFMHLWYIAILLQFDVVFPFVYFAINSTKKLNKALPAIISTIIALAFTVVFFIYNVKAPIMVVYYNTLARVFSLLVGVAVCFIHNLIEQKESGRTDLFKLIFWFLMFCLIAMFVFVDSQSQFFAPAMLIATLFTCIAIECAVCINSKKRNVIDMLIKPISDASYEIYLVQYPLIYLYQCLYTGKDNDLLRISVVAFGTVVIAMLLHFAFGKRKNLKKLQLVVLVITLLISGFGGFKYAVAEDHTAELKALEEQLAASAAEMEKQKQEYLEKQQQENDAWQQLLADLEPNEDKIKQTVSELPVICVGDSVMLGAAENLSATFPNGYVDAKVSRSGWAVNEIIQGLTINGPVVIHTGTNGDVPEYVKAQIMKHCKDHEVFWLTVTNDRDVHVNDDLKKFVQKYNNAYLIDWQQLSLNKEGWLYADGIHLPPVGRTNYTNIIFDAIYQVKLEEFKELKEQAIKEHDENLKSKISFYGNSLLVGMYDNLQAGYPNANFVANNDMDFDLLLAELQKAKNDNTLTYRLVFAIDNTLDISKDEYDRLLDLCEGRQVYFVVSKENSKIDNQRAMQIVYTDIADNKENYMADRVHLTEEGNKRLSEIVMDFVNKDNENNKTEGV